MLKRLFFPIINAVVFVMLFAVVGYYAMDTVRWAVIGGIIGFIVGLIIEFITPYISQWIYRRRVLLTVIVEMILVILYGGPFIMVYINTIPDQYPVCCIEESGLGDDVIDVRIPVADGETVAGWYAPPTDDSGAVVMVLHGSEGDRKSSLRHTRILHDAGFGVLVYDQRALGESTGDKRSGGLYDRHDITPIIDWLAARPEVDEQRIGGVGLSLGAHILVMAAPNEPRMKAIWGDGMGLGNADDIPASYTGIANEFKRFMNKQIYWTIELYLGEETVSGKVLVAQIAPRHLTLIAGGRDPYEADFNREYEPHLGENGELWVIENAYHVGGLSAEPERYPERMIEFFDEALR